MYQGSLSFSGSRDHYGKPRPHDPQEVNIVRNFEAPTIGGLYDEMVTNSKDLETGTAFDITKTATACGSGKSASILFYSEI